MIVDEYTLGNLLDQEAFGDVYLGTKNGSQVKYAILKKDSSGLKKFKEYLDNELDILKDINHPNIIKLIDIKEKQDFIYIITEYCNGGKLKQFLEKYSDKALPEEIVQHVMRQIIEAIRYLNNKKIMHRHIDLGHFLINYEDKYDKENNNIMKGKIKLINFQFAKYLKKGELTKTILGIPLNMSPIILNKLNGIPEYKDAEYDEKEDIWSLGIICYELLVGKNPFDSNDMGELVSKVNNGEYFIPITLSKEAISFINCMLKFDSQKRLSIDELYNHEFLRKNVNEFKKMNLDIINKYEEDSKIKISTKDDGLIQKLLEKPISEVKNKEN